MSTALLICMENSFWNTQVHIKTDFEAYMPMELFKKSFTLYVESGMRRKTEAALDIFGNEQDGCWVTKDFKTEFFKIIIEHRLCEFHCFYLYSTHLTTFFT